MHDEVRTHERGWGRPTGSVLSLCPHECLMVGETLGSGPAAAAAATAGRGTGEVSQGADGGSGDVWCGGGGGGVEGRWGGRGAGGQAAVVEPSLSRKGPNRNSTRYGSWWPLALHWWGSRGPCVG